MLAGSQRNAVEAEFCLNSPGPISLEKIGICHIASGDRWAGAEVQLAMLLRCLACRTDLRVSVILLNEGRLADEVRQCGLDVCVLPESQYNSFQIALRAAYFLRGRDVQVLHSHRYKENMLAAVLARRCRIPVHVCSRHGAPEPFSGWRRYKQGVIEAVNRFVAQHSVDCVVSVSEDLRRQLVRYLPESKIVTIHNGIDLKRVFSPLSVSQAKERLGIPAELSVIGTVGRLEPIKRLDLFLAAAQEIATAQPDTRFVIAGEGIEESRLRSLAASLGLKDRVLFLGHREDVYDVLRALDISVLCSDHEGLPMTLLETLYLGVPVVARPVGGVAEVIQDGVNGVCVNSSEPAALARECIHILRDLGLRKRLVEAGTRIIGNRFSVENTAEGVVNLYRSLVGQSLDVST